MSTETPQLSGIDLVTAHDVQHPSEILTQVERKPSPVVRTFPVIHRFVAGIEEAINAAREAGTPISDIDLLHVPLMRKSDESVPSAGRLIPIGGKIEEGETLIEAALREIGEETTSINPTFHWKKEDIETATVDHARAYSYSILKEPDHRGTSRRRRRAYKSGVEQWIYNVVLDATNLTGREPDIIDTTVDKASGIEFFTTKNIVAHIRGTTADGDRTYEMIGGSQMGRSDDIDANFTQSRNRRRILQATIDQIQTREANARSQLLSIVNYRRQFFYGQEPVASLDDEALTTREILEGYENLRHKALMAGFHKEAEDERKTLGEDSSLGRIEYLKKNLGPLLGKDVLYYAKIFAQTDIDQLGGISAHTDRTVVSTLNYMKGLLREGFATTDPRFEAKPGPRSPNEKKEWTKFMLRSLAEEYPRYDFDEQQAYDRQLSRTIEDRICEDFGMSPQALKFVQRSAIQLIDEMVDEEASRSGSETAEQWHDLLNEVRNANIGQLMLMSLGVTQHADLKDKSPDVYESYRFEASKALVMIMKGISIYPAWQEKNKRGKKFFADLSAKVFGPPVRFENTQVTLSDGTVQNRELTYRQSGKFDEVVVDDVPPKEFISFLRKSLEVPVEEIRDIFRFNVGLTDDKVSKKLRASGDFKNYARHKVLQSMAMSSMLIGGREQLGVFKEVLGENYETRILDRRNTYYDFLDYLNSGHMPEKNGKRGGSKGSRIVREKFILEVKGQDENGDDFTSHCEITCNPLLRLEDDSDGKFLGLLDKIADVGYYFDRITAPMTHYNHATGKPDKKAGYPSLYEMLHPSHLYPQSIKVIRSRLSKQRADRKKEAADSSKTWGQKIVARIGRKKTPKKTA